MTLLNKEIKSGNLAAQTLNVSAGFNRADGSTATVSGTVEVFANGEHEVNISGADIMRLKMSMDEFEAASNAMSLAAFGPKPKVLNLTQHQETEDQERAGVFSMNEEDHNRLKSLLTFDKIPDKKELWYRANEIAMMAEEYMPCNDEPRMAMIGGAPFFMSAMEKALLSAGIQPVYAFSVRESLERTDSEGRVVKTNIFKHVGFVEVK